MWVCLHMCKIMAKGSSLKSCLFFNVAINCVWIFLYFLQRRNEHHVLNEPETVEVVSIIPPCKNNKTVSTVDSTLDTDMLLDTLDQRLKVKPYIFIGGVPSSGTTLVRAMLDAHPDIRCGEETRLVPRILQMRERWIRTKQENKRLKAAGLNETVITRIVRNFVSNVIELHGPKANFLCNKDPLSLSQMPFLHQMFSKAKFLLIIRDGRAVANSIVSRNITITGVDHKSYLSAAMFWNKAVEKMWKNCKSLGSKHCLPVYFERLVDTPKEEINKVLEFLKIPWNENVLHHSDFIASEVSLSK